MVLTSADLSTVFLIALDSFFLPEMIVSTE